MTAPAQALCPVPWCVLDDFGTHASRITRVRTTEPGGIGQLGVGVCLISTGDRDPELYVGPELALSVAQAPHLARLLSRLGHYELAAAVTSTVTLTGDRYDTAHHCSLCGLFHDLQQPCPEGAS